MTYTDDSKISTAGLSASGCKGTTLKGAEWGRC